MGHEVGQGKRCAYMHMYMNTIPIPVFSVVVWHKQTAPKTSLIAAFTGLIFLWWLVVRAKVKPSAHVASSVIFTPCAVVALSAVTSAGNSG